MDETEFPALIRELYDLVARLENMFPGRHFTPDGHLVGSIGEAFASYYYGVKLHRASFEGHDGTVGERLVEVKATQGTKVALSSEPQHLLVLKLFKDGSFEEVYNGPGAQVWARCNPPQAANKSNRKRGQYHVSLSVLKTMMATVDKTLALKVVHPLPTMSERSV
ncbi:MAG: hypothetical protein EAZ11_11610 [Curvibacter sp.]|nr:MAG: hypothetical protein EAZ11_11610 [Curvibacter sp.]